MILTETQCRICWTQKLCWIAKITALLDRRTLLYDKSQGPPIDEPAGVLDR
jgi:hypothetical protein